MLVCFVQLYSPVMKSDSAAIFWTNPKSLRSCPFPSFPLGYLTSFQLICCLFEAPNIMFIKHLIQGRNKRRGWNRTKIVDHAGRKNVALTLLVTLLTTLLWPVMKQDYRIIETLSFFITTQVQKDCGAAGID